MSEYVPYYRTREEYIQRFDAPTADYLNYCLSRENEYEETVKKRISGKVAITAQKVSIVISDNVGMTTSYPLNDRGMKLSRYVRISYDGSAEREFFSVWSLSIPLKPS
jgi:hypothetical protein